MRGGRGENYTEYGSSRAIRGSSTRRAAQSNAGSGNAGVAGDCVTRAAGVLHAWTRRLDRRSSPGTARTGSRYDRSIPDRKSTRLNSSHVKISYAVFCLKKKIVDMLSAHMLSGARRMLADWSNLDYQT